MNSAQDKFPELPGYKIEAHIGQGGMAGVFLARKIDTDETVAIKLLLRKFADDADFQKRFLREADFVARLSHPNIIRVINVEPSDEHLFIVMEYVGGGDLRGRIAQGLSIEASLDILQQLGAALTAAHKQGITHRDIKPSNVLFREDGTVVLADFGIAKASNQDTNLTLTGMIPGTPRYMSPEQARSRPIDGRSDFYSLGILLYEMLTGEAPFVGTDPVSTALMHITEPVPQFEGSAAYLQPLLERLLVKEPEQRISSDDELRAAMASCKKVDETAFIDSDSTEFITVKRPAVQWHKLSQKKYARAGLFMAVFAVTAALALPAYFNRSPEANALEAEASQATAAKSFSTQSQQKALLDKPDDQLAEVGFSPERQVLEADSSTNAADDLPEDDLFEPFETQPALVEMEASYQPAATLENKKESPTALALLTEPEPVNEEPDEQQQLEELFERGNAQLAENKLTRPGNDNALQTFNTMLTIDADDERALGGIASIVDRYAGLAKQRKSNDLQGAIDLLDRGLKIDAQSQVLLELRKQLAQELADQPDKLEIESLLTAAEKQIKARKYMRPEGDNAYESLRAAQAKSPKDQRIASAFHHLLQQISRQARKQQELENWQAALTYVDDALRIAPKDTALIARKEQISESMQQAAQPAEAVLEEVQQVQEAPKKRKRRIIGNF